VSVVNTARLDPEIAKDNWDEDSLSQLAYYLVAMELSLAAVEVDSSNDLIQFLEALPVSNILKKWLETDEIKIVKITSGMAHFDSLRAKKFGEFFSFQPSLIATTQKNLRHLTEAGLVGFEVINSSLGKFKTPRQETFVGVGQACLKAQISPISSCWRIPFLVQKDLETAKQVVEIVRAFARVNGKIKIYDKLLLMCFLRRGLNGGQRPHQAGLLDGKDLLEQILKHYPGKNIHIYTEFKRRDGRIEYKDSDKDQAVADIHQLLKQFGHPASSLVLLRKRKGVSNPIDKSHLWGSKFSLNWQHFAVSFEEQTTTDITAVPNDEHETRLDKHRMELVKKRLPNDVW